MKKFITIMSLAAMAAVPATAAQLKGTADCSASARTIIGGLNNDSSTVSSFVVSANGVPYSVSSSQYSKVADATYGEPHTITFTASAVSDMSANGVTFGDSSKVKIVTSNFTHLFDCE